MTDVTLLTRPGKCRPVVDQLVGADGQWVTIGDLNPLVTSPQARWYWGHKLHLRFEIAFDFGTGTHIGRAICR
jgi:hypothetical protein